MNVADKNSLFARSGDRKTKNAAEVINLSRLKPGRGFAINGTEKTEPVLLESVSSAGDINDDGFDDIIISITDLETARQTREGQTYVIFGSKDIGADGTFDIDRIDGSNGFILKNKEGNNLSNRVVSNAGDINNDGIDDLVIGADLEELTGKSYVIFGDRNLSSSGIVNLAELNGSNGFAIEDASTKNQVGFSVSNAGDVNNDGIDDLIFSAFISNSNSDRQVKYYVVCGHAKIGNSGSLKLSDINGNNGLAIATREFDRNTESHRNIFDRNIVSNAGDVNNDGIDDILIGSEQTERSYVIFGRENLGDLRELDLYQLDPQNGFVIGIVNLSFSRIERETADSRDDGIIDLSNDMKPHLGLGKAVSNAGDVNHDGIDDIIITSPYNNDGTGAAYIVFGNNNIDSSGRLDVWTLNDKTGFGITGIDPGDRLGYSVSNAGDFNNDGIDDIVIIAQGSFGNSLRSPNKLKIVGREAYIIFGGDRLDRANYRNLSQLKVDKGIILRKYGTDSNYSANNLNSISNAGDVNGDGISDIVVGMSGGSTAANSYVIFGSQQYGIGAARENNSISKQDFKTNSLFKSQSSIVFLLLLLTASLLAFLNRN